MLQSDDLTKGMLITVTDSTDTILFSAQFKGLVLKVLVIMFPFVLCDVYLDCSDVPTRRIKIDIRYTTFTRVSRDYAANQGVELKDIERSEHVFKQLTKVIDD